MSLLRTINRSVPLRIAAALAALVAAAGLVASVGAGPAAAVERDTLVVGIGTQSTTFPGIPGSNPTVYEDETLRTIDPDGCRSSTSCDTIPVVFDIPEIGGSDDVRVKFTINWEDGSDLDVFFWDNRQLKEDPAPEETPYFEFTRSAGSSAPETFSILNPVLDAYNITINAWLGPNGGYTITTEMVVDEFKPPFEDLGEEPPPPTTTTTSTTTTTTTTTTPAVVGPPTTTTTTLPPVSLPQQGGGFESFEGTDVEAPPDFESSEFVLGRPTPAAETIDPPSTAVVLLTTIAVPTVLLLPGFLWLQRRRSASLEV